MLSSAYTALLRKPGTRLNTPFLVTCLQERCITPAQLDAILASGVLACRAQLEKTSLGPVLSDVLQQLLVSRHVLFASQLTSTLAQLGDLLAAPSPALQPLQAVLLRLQRNYQVLGQEAVYQPNFTAVLAAWLQLCAAQPGAPREEDVVTFIVALRQKGLLASETQTVIAVKLLFVALLAELDKPVTAPSSTSSTTGSTGATTTTSTMNTSNSTGAADNTSPVDAFIALLAALLRYTDLKSRASLLLCFVTAVASVLAEEQKAGKSRGAAPAYRVLAALTELLLGPLLPRLQPGLHDSDRVLATDYARVLLHGLQLLQPAIVPSFVFFLLALASSATLLRVCALLQDDTTSSLFSRLLFALLRFLMPFWVLASPAPALRQLVAATTSLLLALKERWPQLLCANYGDLCLAVPTYCLQLRNIITAAQPPATPAFSPRDGITDELAKALNTPTPDAWNVGKILAPLNLEPFFAAYPRHALRGLLLGHGGPRQEAELLRVLRAAVRGGRRHLHSRRPRRREAQLPRGLLHAAAEAVAAARGARHGDRAAGPRAVPLLRHLLLLHAHEDAHEARRHGARCSPPSATACSCPDRNRGDCNSSSPSW